MTVQQIQILDISEIAAAACACGDTCTCGSACACGPDGTCC